MDNYLKRLYALFTYIFLLSLLATSFSLNVSTRCFSDEKFTTKKSCQAFYAENLPFPLPLKQIPTVYDSNLSATDAINNATESSDCKDNILTSLLPLREEEAFFFLQAVSWSLTEKKKDQLNTLQKLAHIGGAQGFENH